MKKLNKNFIGIAVILLANIHSYAQDNTKQSLLYPALVEEFYTTDTRQLFWFNNSESAGAMRILLLNQIDSSAYSGITKYNRYDELQKINAEPINENDTAGLIKRDILFTDAAIAYCKELYQGDGINSVLLYDEWSGKYATIDNDFLISHLVKINSPGELLDFFHSLEPSTKEYLAYKNELKSQYALRDTGKTKQVAMSMNFYRWIHHFGFEKFIEVNIPSATLGYYINDSEVLFSNVVVGKPATRTPRFDASCPDIILYPYWNVPQSIAIKEVLPKVRKSQSYLQKENMQVLDTSGNVVDPYDVQWFQLDKSYFPYHFRQETGCDDALGIIKFNLTSPFDVYLHDTNEKGLFKSNYRFKSHGCMRVEKAVELGNSLLNNKLDTAYLQACIKGEKLITIQLDKPVPVFVVYLTAKANDSCEVNYYTDVYHLLH